MDNLKVNQYFEGKVKSISFTGEKYASTVGVMAPGEYEFGTGKAEIMTVISGALTISMPNHEAWHTYEAGQKFEVPANSKFQLKVSSETAYLCQFVD